MRTKSKNEKIGTANLAEEESGRKTVKRKRPAKKTSAKSQKSKSPKKKPVDEQANEVRIIFVF